MKNRRLLAMRNRRKYIEGISWSLRAIPLVVATFVLSACSGVQELPPEAVTDSLNRGAAQDANGYRIGPGDQLEIFVWRNPEISAKVPVRPDGKISTPLVEDMIAVGKTPSKLARDMEQVLETYIKNPAVNVIVTDFKGVPGEQVRVVGQAVNPQAVPFRQGMTVLDVMIAVGGLSEFASGNRAKIVRKIDGQIVEFRLRLDDLLNKGRVNQNVKIEPGDVIFIPESLF